MTASSPHDCFYLMKFMGTHLAIIAAVILTLVVQVINHLFVLLNKSDKICHGSRQSLFSIRNALATSLTTSIEGTTHHTGLFDII